MIQMVVVISIQLEQGGTPPPPTPAFSPEPEVRFWHGVGGGGGGLRHSVGFIYACLTFYSIRPDNDNVPASICGTCRIERCWTGYRSAHDPGNRRKSWPSLTWGGGSGKSAAAG
jgi:hypothetical protein